MKLAELENNNIKKEPSDESRIAKLEKVKAAHAVDDCHHVKVNLKITTSKKNLVMKVE